MDKDGSHFLSKEYCYFDWNHKRCKGFKTLGAYVYHPLLRQTVRLASMETENEDSDAVDVFWTLFDEVLKKCKRDCSYTFNPTGWLADDAGANWEGIMRVFGDVRSRLVSCVLHYKQSVNRHADKLLNQYEKATFKSLANELQKAATPAKYNQTYDKLQGSASG